MNNKYEILTRVLQETGKTYQRLSESVTELEKANAEKDIPAIKAVIEKQKAYLQIIEESKQTISKLVDNNKDLETICRAFGWQVMRPAVQQVRELSWHESVQIKETYRNRFRSTDASEIRFKAEDY